MQTLVGRSHPSLYSFINELQKEQADVEYILRELDLGKKVKKLPTSKQQKIEERISTVVSNYHTYVEKENELEYIKIIGSRCSLQNCCILIPECWLIPWFYSPSSPSSWYPTYVIHFKIISHRNKFFWYFIIKIIEYPYNIFSWHKSYGSHCVCSFSNTSVLFVTLLLLEAFSLHFSIHALAKVEQA